MTEKRALRLTRAAEIQSARQRMLNDLLPLGTVVVFAGRGGEGKSTYALDLIADLNAGRANGDLAGMEVPALIVSIEDDWSTVMKPRLQAAGANLDLVWRLAVTSTVDKDTRETTLALPLDTDLIRAAIIETGARLVVLDPATSLMAGDLNKREDVRRSLDALLVLAQETDATFVLIVHFAKGSGNVSEKISGSHALRDAARCVLLFATDEDTGNRIVSIDKANYSAAQAGSFAFSLIDTTVPTDDGDLAHVAKVVHLGASDVSVHDVVNRSEDDAGDDRSAAEAFIIDYLRNTTDCEAPASEVLKAGRAAGFSDNVLKHARNRSKHRPQPVRSEKSAFGAGWVWALGSPEDATKVPKVPKVHAPTPSGTFPNMPPAPGPGTFGTFGTLGTFDDLALAELEQEQAR